MRYHERAPFVPITERPKLTWPNGARLAVWVLPNVEYFDEERLVGATVTTPAKEPPDIPNYSWREFGLRVGIWRLMEVLRELGVPATVAMNSMVCMHYPQVVKACVELGWEIMGHGRTNSESLPGMAEADERALIAESLSVLERHTGKRPVGWLGPSLAETNRTLDLLAEHGIQYVADWVNDEQPYMLKTIHGDIVSMPHSNEINDIAVFMRRGFTGPEYEQMLRVQFDELYADGAQNARVMSIGLHPFLTGVAFRAHHLKAALRYMCDRPGVWFATGSEILAAYRVARGVVV